MQSRKEFTVVVLGARNTGKTEMVEYFVFGPNTKPTRPTIEDIYRKSVNGKILNIIDTSGEESTIEKLRQLYISTANAFIITFDVKNSKTIARAKLEYEHIVDFGKPIIVVGTYHGEIDENVEKKRAIFRKANFFIIDLNRKESIIQVFESLFTNVAPARRLRLCC